MPDDAPTFITDLNFDAMVAAATRGRDNYKLRAFFISRSPSSKLFIIANPYFENLKPAICAHLTTFGRQLHTMRQRLAKAGRARYKNEREWWFIDAVSIYCEAVQTVRDALAVNH